MAVTSEDSDQPGHLPSLIRVVTVRMKKIRPVWSESSLSTWRNLGSLATNWAHSEDSDLLGLGWAHNYAILLVLSTVLSHMPFCSWNGNELIVTYRWQVKSLGFCLIRKWPGLKSFLKQNYSNVQLHSNMHVMWQCMNFCVTRVIYL